jgi:2-oxoglutarate/2-oxoacid ferredoxin oxidoreductase subunit alpha
MSNKDILTIMIGGSAGQGIRSAGLLLAKLATRSGLNIFTHSQFPSLIRGGHNTIQISISQNEVRGVFKKVDMLVALNQETVERHGKEMKAGSMIIGDEGLVKIESGASLMAIPLRKLAEEAGNRELMVNSVALGSVATLLGGDINILKELMSEEFQTKGEGAVEGNLKAVELGANFVRENYNDKCSNKLKPVVGVSEKVVINGNSSVALGAIAAGLQFSAIYPMSPISGILEVLAANQEKYGYIYKQPEDEISAINMAIGASFAGARAMTATSGGGFCLMTEGLGLAAMTETPLVIIEGMRNGPATGLPTWSEQGDLRFVLSAHQGESPRIVLAAGDAKEAFELTGEAFNLADKYQLPVILLVDKNVCECDQSFSRLDFKTSEINRGKVVTIRVDGYQRYKLEADGVSIRTVPGSGNYFIANSDEHDVTGFSSDEIEVRNEQMKKRMAKMYTISVNEMLAPKIFGPAEAEVTVVSWGSNKGSILEAIDEFESVNFMYLMWMSPFPAEAVKNVLARSKYLLDVECNYSGLLAGLIREKCGIEIKDRLLKDDGRPLMVEEIVEKINSVLKIHE